MDKLRTCLQVDSALASFKLQFALSLTGPLKIRSTRFPPLYYGRLSKGKKLKRYRGVRVWHLNAADEGSSNRLCGQFGTESATSAIQQRRQEQGDLQGGHVILVIRRQVVHF